MGGWDEDGNEAHIHDLRGVKMNEYKKRAADLRKKVMDIEKDADRQYDMGDKVEKAQEIRDFYDSFVEVGFTEEQAWELLIECVRGSFKR